MKAIAQGPRRAGCHDIPEINPEKFWSLGGSDIVVWGTDYTIEAATVTAFEYVVTQLSLTDLEFVS